jgi:hypothetical protein
MPLLLLPAGFPFAESVVGSGGHYAIVSWLGYALLDAPLPVLIKFLLVLAGSLGLSWMAAALLRRIPGVARVL